jgi:hypothetical protein
LENKIKAIFNEKFTLIAGYKYFEGDEYEVLETFCREVWDHMKLYYEDESDDDSCDETDYETDYETDDIIEIVVKRKAKEKKRPRVVVRKKVQVDVPKTKYQCISCGEYLKCKRNLDYHTTNKVCKKGQFPCKYCKKKLSSSTSMYRHIREFCKQKDKQTKIEKLEDGINELRSELAQHEDLEERFLKMERIINNETESESESESDDN